MERTLWIFGLPEQHTRLCAKDDGTVRCCHMRVTMAQIPLEFVHVVRALAATSCVLAVNRVNAQAARANAQKKGILKHLTERTTMDK